MKSMSVAALLSLARMGALHAAAIAQTSGLASNSQKLAEDLEALEYAQISLEAKRGKIQVFSCWAMEDLEDPGSSGSLF